MLNYSKTSQEKGVLSSVVSFEPRSGRRWIKGSVGPQHEKRGNLGSASRASLGGTRLGVGGNSLKDDAISLHDGIADIRALGVLVSALTGVESRAVRRVSIPSLEGVEVVGRAGLAGVPHGVNILLGSHVPKLVVILSVVGVDGARRSSGDGGGSSRGSSGRGGSTSSISHLQVFLETGSLRDGLTRILVLHGSGVTGISHTTSSKGRPIEEGSADTSLVEGREGRGTGDEGGSKSELHL